MLQFLNSLQKKLTNLTGSNKSILQLRLYNEQDLDIHELDFLTNKPSFNYIKSLLLGKKDINLLDEADSRNSHVNAFSQKLKLLLRKVNFIVSERGSQDLYLGYPFVHGKLVDGTTVRCPLLFFPVSIEIYEGQWVIQSRSNPVAQFNKSFLLAYAHYNQIALDKSLFEHQWEEIEEEPRVFLTNLYQLLKSSSLQVQFNQLLFEEKLQTFENYKKDQFEANFAAGILKLIPEAVLGIYPQAGSYLYDDYTALIQNPPAADLESFFISKNSSSQKIKEEKLITPLELDGSQEKAIEFIKNGNSLVVQGPPGTGKSQLIANIICDHIANNKKVLLACSKRVALDVVYERLARIGIGAYVSLVHDHKGDRKSLYTQLATQIEAIDQYQIENSALDTVFLEKDFKQISRKIDQLTTELESFKKALFDTSIAGISIKELYLKSRGTTSLLTLNHDYKSIRPIDLPKYTSVLRSWLRYAIKFERDDYLWKNRVSMSHTSYEEIPNFKEVILKITNNNRIIIEYFQKFGLTLTSITDIKDLKKNTTILTELVQKLNSDSDIEILKLQLYKKKLKRQFEKTVFEYKNWLITDWYKGKASPLHLLNVCDEALKATKNQFYEKKWQIFEKKPPLLIQELKSNNLKVNRAGLVILKSRLENRINLDHSKEELAKIGINPGEVPITEEELELWTNKKWMLMATMEQAISLGVTEELLLKKWLKNSNIVTFSKEVNDWVNLCDSSYPLIVEASNRLHPNQINWLLATHLADELIASLTHDLDELSEYDLINESLTHVEKKIAFELLHSTHHINSIDEKIAVLEKSVQLSWISHIEAIYPVLRMVSTPKIEDIENELQELIIQKQVLSTHILLLKAKENTYKDLTFNRLKNRVSYRNLLHEVTKKKKILPLRQLLEKFHSEVFDLMPCWLASPDTISSIFPLNTVFDIVIFDEASQCFVEEGIPSMCRGKQLLIVGDSQQLQPNDLYQPRWEEDLDHSDLQIDSLLDLSIRYLPQIMLTGHYRSRYLSLIQFSNQHFYKNKLSLIPFKDDMNNNIPAIVYQKVEGLWDNNTNIMEAQEVVFWVEKYTKDYPVLSIGIITFNYKQQKLIQDLIEERFNEKNIILPKSLFVKNIENVQGDERDIIIFSIGYGPSKSGKFAMNFGSLNLDGGQNRLNVAITRAREKMILVTSIFPNQLNVAESKHLGPKLLKEFLIYSWHIQNTAKENSQENRNLQSLTPTLISKLENNNYQNKLPFADLVEIRESQYYSLILTDDNRYFQSLSAKEAHGYIPLILKNKNWPIKREFSRNWWKNG